MLLATYYKSTITIIMELYPFISYIYVALALDAYPIPLQCQESLCHERKIGYFTDSVQALDGDDPKVPTAKIGLPWFKSLVFLDLSNQDMVI